MKTVITILSTFIFSGLIFGSSNEMDNHYDKIDEDYPILAAHKKTTNNNKDMMRKRAYKRKRMRRLPNNGK
tara:strand:+ start:404 stop:616 length:213 start_codon:yes stop_codon:yes gene_type:complete